ncbi:hypothetical protein CRUP_015492 [Coryphaenoides rupestris]|nr:hypothetical protein CRUP_015492 [Coryphaenoides rupestris]
MNQVKPSVKQDQVQPNEELLIERSIYKGMMNPGEERQKVLHRGSSATMEYTVQVRCDDFYYSNQCNKKHLRDQRRQLSQSAAWAASQSASLPGLGSHGQDCCYPFTRRRQEEGGEGEGAGGGGGGRQEEEEEREEEQNPAPGQHGRARQAAPRPRIMTPPPGPTLSPALPPISSSTAAKPPQCVVLESSRKSTGDIVAPAWVTVAALSPLSPHAVATSWTRRSPRARGYFELQLLSVENLAGELASRACCDGDGDGTREAEREYQTAVSPTGACTYGSALTGVLGGNTFHFHKSAKHGAGRAGGGEAGRIEVEEQEQEQEQEQEEVKEEEALTSVQSASSSRATREQRRDVPMLVHMRPSCRVDHRHDPDEGRTSAWGGGVEERGE